MKSITKCDVSESVIRDVSKLVWGEAPRRFDELKDGWFNTAIRIETEGGKSGILKIAPPDHIDILRYEADAMKVEVDVLRLMKSKTSIPVPEVYHYNTEKEIIGSDFFVMETLPGRPYDKVKEEMSAETVLAIESELGCYNRQINEIVGNGFGMYSRSDALHGDWYACFYELMSDLLNDGKRKSIDLDIGYDEVLELVKKQKHALDTVKTPRLVHWDLWAGNIFVDNGTITGIVDFERALWGDRLMEVFFHSGPYPGFLQGYDIDVSRDEEFAQERMSLYGLYVAIIMVVECYYRNFSDEHREWAEGHLKEKFAFAASQVR